MCIQCQHKVCAQHVVYEYETERPMHSVCPPAGGFNTKWEVSSFEQQYNRAMREHRQRSAARQTRGREQEVRSRIESFLAAMRDTGDKGSRRVSRRRMVPRRMRSGLVAKDEPFPDRGWHVGDHAGDVSPQAARDDAIRANEKAGETTVSCRSVAATDPKMIRCGRCLHRCGHPDLRIARSGV